MYIYTKFVAKFVNEINSCFIVVIRLNMEQAYKRAPSSILSVLILNSRVQVMVMKNRVPQMFLY